MKSIFIYVGDDFDVFYYIIKGMVMVVIEDDDGCEMIMVYLNEGDFFGEMGLFDEVAGCSVWIRVKMECEVVEISYNKFK